MDFDIGHGSIRGLVQPPLFIHKISVEVAIMQVLETTDVAPDDQ
jgi:hypothetical protein